MHVQWSTVAVVGIVVTAEVVMGALHFEGAEIAALGTIGALASGIMRAMFEAKQSARNAPAPDPRTSYGLRDAKGERQRMQ